MDELAYKPISIDNVTNINAPKEIDKPDYPDKGVEYAGFSKTLLGGNDFQLNPQIEADINFFVTWLFGETGNDLNRVNQVTKDFYLKRLYFNHHNNGAVTGSVCSITFKSGSGGTIFLSLQENPATFATYDIEFPVPIKIEKGSPVHIEFSRARVANESSGINLYGWEE